MRFLLEMKGYHTDMGGAICVLEAHRVITGKKKICPNVHVTNQKGKIGAPFLIFYVTKKN